MSAPSSSISPSTAPLRPLNVSVIVSKAARIEAGLALYASFTRWHPDFSSISNRIPVISRCDSPSWISDSVKPSEAATEIAANAFSTLCRPGIGRKRCILVPMTSTSNSVLVSLGRKYMPRTSAASPVPNMMTSTPGAAFARISAVYKLSAFNTMVPPGSIASTISDFAFATF